MAIRNYFDDILLFSQRIPSGLLQLAGPIRWYTKIVEGNNCRGRFDQPAYLPATAHGYLIRSRIMKAAYDRELF